MNEQYLKSIDSLRIVVQELKLDDHDASIGINSYISPEGTPHASASIVLARPPNPSEKNLLGNIKSRRVEWGYEVDEWAWEHYCSYKEVDISWIFCTKIEVVAA